MQKKLPLRRRIYTGTMRALMYLSAGLTAALVLFLIGYVLLKGVPTSAGSCCPLRRAIWRSASASCRTF